MVPAFIWVSWLILYYYCLAVFYNSCIHTLSTDDSITGQFRLAGWLSGKVCSHSHCPEQAQLWGQTELLRALPVWGIKPPRADMVNLLGPWLHFWVVLGLSYFNLCHCLSSATLCEEPGCVSSIPSVTAGSAVESHPFSQLSHFQHCSFSLQN